MTTIKSNFKKKVSSTNRNKFPYVYTGPALKQQQNHSTLHEGQKFFVRALAHCYNEIEGLLRQISKTPPAWQKALRIKKAKLQREAEYIINVKLKGVKL